MPTATLVIACGAIAHELTTLFDANRWEHVQVRCLPASWHNTPERITPAVEALIVEHRARYGAIFVAYGDCGTGGQLDRMLATYGVERLPGDHCYAFFAGERVFDELTAEELGSFYLTDYLARNFDRLILDGMGISRHPELKDMLFAHYTRVVYLAQSDDPARLADAERAAAALALPLCVRYTGLTPLASALNRIPVIAV